MFTNKRSMRSILKTLLVTIAILCSSSASANWTLNVGYQNPIVSTWGLNLLYIGSHWGLEAGVGWIDAKANIDNDGNDSTNNNDTGDDDSASIKVAGDIDLKYFFSSGAARPFLQGGFGVGLGAKSGEGAGAGTVVAYAASKGAINALTRASAIDLAISNVRVNAILPGSVDTPMLRTSADMHRGEKSIEEVLSDWGAGHPLGRIAKSSEIGDLAVFLVSNESAFITGQSIVIDGGLSIQVPVILPGK